MFAKLFLLFAILPIVEIALLINMGDVIGGWNTVAIVIITAFLGAHLVRKEGINTLATAQQKMQSGEMPGQQMAEGLLLLVAGVLLVTPGFITDGIGFLFSMPFTRPLIATSLMKQFGHKVVMQQTRQQSSSQGFGGFEFHQQFHQPEQPNARPEVHTSRDGHNVIEGEYQRKDD